MFAKIIGFISNVFNITDWDATNIDYKKMNDTLKVMKEIPIIKSRTKASNT